MLVRSRTHVSSYPLSSFDLYEHFLSPIVNKIGLSSHLPITAFSTFFEGMSSTIQQTLNLNSSVLSTSFLDLLVYLRICRGALQSIC